MQVVVISDISKGRRKISKWALAGEVNVHSQWSLPPRRKPTAQNIKLWRDCLLGTCMKGIDDLLHPVTDVLYNCFGISAHPPFHYEAMKKKAPLIELLVSIRQNSSHYLAVLAYQTLMVETSWSASHTTGLILVVTAQPMMGEGCMHFAFLIMLFQRNYGAVPQQWAHRGKCHPFRQNMDGP